MDTPITRAEHEEFRRRMEDENKRQDARLAALTDLQDRLIAASNDWLRRVKDAEDFVDRIGNVEYRILLQLRYIDCNRWDDVQRIMERFGLYYSNRQMFRLHGNALQEARRLWNEESEEG